MSFRAHLLFTGLLVTTAIACLCGIGMLSGCSAMASRSFEALGPSPQPPLYFGGIRSDYNVISAEGSKDSWLWAGYCIIDTPLSFGADILFVPYDVYTDCRWSKRDNSGSHFAAP
jgi:uncharacterized protein YceK